MFEVDGCARRRFPTVMVNDGHRFGMDSTAGAVIMEVAWQDARIDILNCFAELFERYNANQLSNSSDVSMVDSQQGEHGVDLEK